MGIITEQRAPVCTARRPMRHPIHTVIRKPVIHKSAHRNFDV